MRCTPSLTCMLGFEVRHAGRALRHPNHSLSSIRRPQREHFGNPRLPCRQNHGSVAALIKLIQLRLPGDACRVGPTIPRRGLEGLDTIGIGLRCPNRGTTQNITGCRRARIQITRLPGCRTRSTAILALVGSGCKKGGSAAYTGKLGPYCEKPLYNKVTGHVLGGGEVHEEFVRCASG
jgi:hypothetical protein